MSTVNPPKRMETFVVNLQHTDVHDSRRIKVMRPAGINTIKIIECAISIAILTGYRPGTIIADFIGDKVMYFMNLAKDGKVTMIKKGIF